MPCWMMPLWSLVHDGRSASESNSVKFFNNAVVEFKMMLLFQMMYWMGAGAVVAFEDVVKSIFHVTKHMEDIAYTALLMCDDNNRQLDCPQFSSLDSLEFHDVANSMADTLSLQGRYDTY